MLLYASLSLILLLLPESESLQLKTQSYKMRTSQQRLGPHLYTQHVNVGTRCSMLCLTESCTGYNVISGEEDGENGVLCEVFGEEPGPSGFGPFTDNHLSDYYGEAI